MAKPPGLRKRGGSWEMRVRVPERLRAAMGKGEIIKSFGGTSNREALRLATQASGVAGRRLHIRRMDIFDAPRQRYLTRDTGNVCGWICGSDFVCLVVWKECKRSGQEATKPPSTRCAEPVIDEASALSRKLTIGATSSAVVHRPVACRSSRSFQIASSVSSASVRGVRA